VWPTKLLAARIIFLSRRRLTWICWGEKLTCWRASWTRWDNPETPLSTANHLKRNACKAKNQSALSKTLSKVDTPLISWWVLMASRTKYRCSNQCQGCLNPRTWTTLSILPSQGSCTLTRLGKVYHSLLWKFRKNNHPTLHNTHPNPLSISLKHSENLSLRVERNPKPGWPT